MSKKIYLFFVLALFLGACSKEKRMQNDISGTWNVVQEDYDLFNYSCGTSGQSHYHTATNLGTITFTKDKTEQKSIYATADETYKGSMSYDYSYTDAWGSVKTVKYDKNFEYELLEIDNLVHVNMIIDSEYFLEELIIDKITKKEFNFSYSKNDDGCTYDLFSYKLSKK